MIYPETDESVESYIKAIAQEIADAVDEGLIKRFNENFSDYPEFTKIGEEEK